MIDKRLYAVISGDGMPVKSHIDERECHVELRYATPDGRQSRALSVTLDYPDGAERPRAMVHPGDADIDVLQVERAHDRD